MTDSSIQHPNDTPVSRVDILKMKEAELRAFIENIQSKRESVFHKRDSIKKSLSKARLDDTYKKIENLLTRAEKKAQKADASLSEATDLLTKVRALELELDYLAEATEAAQEEKDDSEDEVHNE